MAFDPLDKPAMSTTTQGDTFAGPLCCVGFYWHSKGASAGDDLLISDGDGDAIWADSATGANYSNYFPFYNTVDTLTVTTLDSGTFTIIRAPLNHKFNSWY
jgi:hypothetical protein